MVTQNKKPYAETTDLAKMSVPSTPTPNAELLSARVRLITKANNDLWKKIGAVDLIAAEVKYHSNCLVYHWQFYQKSVTGFDRASASESTQCKDCAWSRLISEIEEEVQHSKVFSSAAVFKRYVGLGRLISQDHFL